VAVVVSRSGARRLLVAFTLAGCTTAGPPRPEGAARAPQDPHPAAAATAEQPAPLLEWNAATRAIRCPDTGTWLVLRDAGDTDARMTEGDGTALPVGARALVVMPRGTAAGGVLRAVAAPAADPLQDFVADWKALHRLASGGRELEQDPDLALVDVAFRDHRLALSYGPEGASGARWTMVYVMVQLDGVACRIGALDRMPIRDPRGGVTAWLDLAHHGPDGLFLEDDLGGALVRRAFDMLRKHRPGNR
jgi:hypothetical protein